MGELSCERFVNLLSDYAEGALPSDDLTAMNAHLLACEGCRQLLADYESIPAVVRRATNIAMPSGAQARLRRLLAHAWRRRT